MADRHALYKHGAKEIAWQQGALGHLHGEVRHGRGGLVLPPPLLALGPGRARALFAARGRGRVAALPASGWPASWRWRASSRSSTRRPSTRTSATRRARSRPRASWRAGTTAPAASGSAARDAGFRVENRIPGADANPYLAFAATIAAGLHGIERKLKAPRALRGQCLRGSRRSRRCRRPCARRSTTLEPLQGRARGLRRPRGRALPPAAPTRAGGLRPGGHRLGAQSAFRTDLKNAMAGRLDEGRWR